VKRWKSVGRLPKKLRLEEGFYRVLPDVGDPFENGGTFQVVGEDAHVQL